MCIGKQKNKPFGLRGSTSKKGLLKLGGILVAQEISKKKGELFFLPPF
jgi:hypothetical protein